MPLQGWSMFLASYRLVKHLHTIHQFDCIDAHYVYPDGFAAALLGKTLGLPVVVSARGTDINVFPSFRLIRPMIEWTLKHVAGGIGVSTPLLEAMVAHGLPRTRARVIGNGVDLQRFYAVDALLARAHLKLSADKPLIVAVGGLVPSKGLSLLISAIAKVKKRYPDVQLYVIGKGSERSKLETLVAQLQLQNSVFLVGPRPNEQLKDWYSAAQLTCLASSREGWANVLLESMACGTPVVATRIGGTTEVISSPQLGILVEQDVDSLAHGIETALAKRWNRQDIMQYARQRTWEQVAAEVDEVLSAWSGQQTHGDKEVAIKVK
jgi:glycosyltransferase involved in cell wall biosynthesis